MRVDAGDGGPGSGAPATWRTRRSVIVLALVAVLLTAAVGPAGAAPADPADTAFVVALDDSGDAEVTLRLAFDVSTEQDRRALERLQGNRSTFLAEFHEGMATVAAGAASETGRNMTVSDPTMQVTAEDERGIVELSVTWEGLAAADGDRLRVTAPFDDGFEPPGRFVIRAPEGYTVATATPAPSTESGPEAAWEAGTRLDGFEATFQPADAAGGTPAQSMPGFGVPAALLALLLALLVAGSRS